MILYTCGSKTAHGSLGHPCGVAGDALDKAGYEYEIRPLRGYRLLPWTRRSRDEDRAIVRELSGTNEVPVLVLDDGTVVSDSRRIKKWAKEHPAAATAPAPDA